jgi:hypothetical protein
MVMGDNGAECESKFMVVTLRIRSTIATECCGPWKPSRPGARRQLALHPRARIAQDACTLSARISEDEKANGCTNRSQWILCVGNFLELVY